MTWKFTAANETESPVFIDDVTANDTQEFHKKLDIPHRPSESPDPTQHSTRFSY